MVKKIVDVFIEDLSKTNDYNNVQKEQMKYILSVLIYEFIKLIAILIIFSLSGYFKECALILLFMTLTKPFTGGYHEDSQIRCFIATIAIVICILTLSKSTNLNIISCLILNSISIFCIYNQIPIINKKMPLTKKKLIDKNRKLGIINTSILLILSIVLFEITWVSQSIVWTSIIQTMLLFNKYKK